MSLLSRFRGAAPLLWLCPALAFGAGDSPDPIAAGRHLREIASSILPLPETGSGITRDVGGIAVIEFDERSYDMTDP